MTEFQRMMLGGTLGFGIFIIKLYFKISFIIGGVNWSNVTCQATQKKPWMEKNQTFSRGGRQTEQRNNSQVIWIRLEK